MDGMTSEA